MPTPVPRSLLAVLAFPLLALLFSACVSHSHRHSSRRVHAPTRRAEIHVHKEVAEVHVHPGYKQGPPPWAPAHGYRHKHRDGVGLVFDADLGVYAAVGHVGVYFHGDRYLRVRGARWEVSVGVGGPWVVVELGDVPRRLRAHVAKVKKTKKAKQARGRGTPPPARHD